MSDQYKNGIPLTHLIFKTKDEKGQVTLQAHLISDLHMSGDIKNISIYNVALDTTYYTTKIRAVTIIEVSKFFSGIFDPFIPLDKDGKEQKS